MKRVIFILLFILSTNLFTKEPDSYLLSQDSLSFTEGTQKFVSENWKKLGHQLDTFFANENYEEELNDSYLRVRFFQTYEHSTGYSKAFKFKVKLDLPYSSKKLKIVVERENDEDEIDDVVKSESGKVANYATSIRYRLFQSEDWTIDNNGGTSLRLPLDPFYKIRIRRSIKISLWELRLVENLMLSRQGGFTESSSFDLLRKIDSTTQLEFTNKLSYGTDSERLMLEHHFSYQRRLSGKGALSTTFSFYAPIIHKIDYQKIGPGVALRQNLYKGWLFGQLSTGVWWHKTGSVNYDPWVSLLLETIF